ncbi:MAG: homocysteine S-methyltransferase [Nocardioides sp.]
MRRSVADVIAERVVVLDGGLATLLEAQGHDLSSALWSARLLVDDPDAIRSAHRDLFRAGAEVAISASYQVGFENFEALGHSSAEVEDLLRTSVRLAAEARDEVSPGGWVAASVGPYGAVLADGSEYRGDYDLDVAGLRAFHRPRLEVLGSAGADVLACETIPCLAEVEALLAEISGSGHPAWLSVSSVGGKTRAGEPLDQAFKMAAQVPEVIAVGVNCTAPPDVLAALTALHGMAPGIVYPNSGQGWDADRRCWTGEPAFDTADVASWIAAGARLVGGCCRVGIAEISALAGSLQAS